jgi:hypothetical protein
MENPAKKLKIDGELSTNPFFELNTDVHPLVLQHFTSKEVLDLFTVSSKCYQLVSESPAAMKKIQLCFQECSANVPSRQEVTELLNSERKYQNINADFRYLTNAARKLLLLERFSQSLANLVTFLEDYPSLISKLPLSLSFPKLQSLDVKASAPIILKLLQAAGNLETLAIGNMNEEVVACLMEM